MAVFGNAKSVIDCAIAARGEKTRSRAQFLRIDPARLCRRLGRSAEAIASYRKALQLARQEPERRFLERRIAELKKT